MTLRFDWYPRFDHPLIESKIVQIVDLIGSDGSQRKTQEETEKSTKQILSALYSAYFSFPRGSSAVSVSLTSNHYTQSKYSYRIIKKVFECLSELHWIEWEKGSEAGKRITRMWAAGELSLAFDGIGLVWSHQETKPKDGLIELRQFKNPEGTTKKERGPKLSMAVPESSLVQDYRDNLFSFNQFLLKHCVSLELDDQNLSTLAEEIARRSRDKARVWSTEEDERVGSLDFSRVQLRRIFSRGSLEKGGRFYGGWWQSIPSLYRPHIRIDGKKTIEMDYSSMALRIIYALEGISIAEDDDLYDIGLDDWRANEDERRKPIKTFVNAIMNDESGRFRLSQKDQTLVGISHQELLERVLEKHEPIKHQFSTGFGLVAQFIDSSIAEEVMLKMMQEDVLVLPIHDSFIVRAGYANWLHEEMKSAFQRILNAGIGVSIEGIKGNSHFQIPMAEVTSEVISLSSEEAWDAFVEKNNSIMGRYLNSWQRKQMQS